MQMKQGIVGAGALLVGAVLALWVMFERPEERQSHRRDVSEPPLRLVQSAASSSGTGGQGGDPVIDDFLGSEFARRKAADEVAAAKGSVDARVVATGALALWRCAQVMPGMSTPLMDGGQAPALAARQVQARATLQSYCQGIPYGESTHRELLALLERGAANGAPLAQAMLAARQPALRSPQKLCDMALASRLEPEILRHLGSVLPNLPGQRVLGQRYDPGADQLVYRAALEIAACRAGAECSAKSWNVMRACAADGHCKDDDVMDGLFKYLGAKSQRIKVDNLSNRIVESIDERRCFFVLE